MIWSLLSILASTHAHADVSISNSVNGSTLTIRSSDREAGAIDSLTWNGKEFLNSDDHGRELQSASSFDGNGECFNPTEAGSRDDPPAGGSTSVLINRSTAGPSLLTSAKMAFWLKPGETGGCKTPGQTAVNGTLLSDHVLTKHVTIGALGLENVIDYDITFTVPEAHANGTFEALTPYVAADFTNFWGFDAGSGGLTALDIGPGEQTQPIVLATTDSKYAIGLYSPDLPQPGINGGYGRFNFAAVANTNKSNCVFRLNDIAAGDHTFKCYVIIGTLEQVRTSLVALSHGVTGNIDSVTANPTVISGWACARGIADSINVDLYANGQAGTGIPVTRVLANQASEPAVAAACGSSGSAYRFTFNLDAGTTAKYPGMTVWVHGISPTNGPNAAIAGSGNFNFPGTAVAAPPSASGPTATGAATVYQRYYNPITHEHFYTSNAAEALNNGFQAEGPGVKTLPGGTSGTVPLYRCYNNVTHFISADPGCENAGHSEGQYGNVFPTPAAGMVPIYRGFNPVTGDHLTTYDTGELTRNGYILDGTLGYGPAL